MEENINLLTEEQMLSKEASELPEVKSDTENTSVSTEAAAVHENIYDAKNYEDIMREDIEQLHKIFPHLVCKASVLELDNPLRYAALRDMGLTPKEAYLASSNISTSYDNRSHITSSAPRGAAASSDMLSSSELEAARIIFSELSDRDIQKLYKKVTK